MVIQGVAMSERGTFVTQYIYCPNCLEAVRNCFRKHEAGKWFHAIQINMDLYPYPIFAGRISESWPGGEVFEFETEILPALEACICHPVRVVVMPENGDARTFTANPSQEKTA
jgi:hypothetical protein